MAAEDNRLKSVEEALKVIEEAISDDATRGKIARSLHELSDRVRRKQHKQGALRDWKRVVDRLDDASVSPEYAALIRSGKVQSVFANSIERHMQLRMGMDFEVPGHRINLSFDFYGETCWDTGEFIVDVDISGNADQSWQLCTSGLNVSFNESEEVEKISSFIGVTVEEAKKWFEEVFNVFVS